MPAQLFMSLQENEGEATAGCGCILTVIPHPAFLMCERHTAGETPRKWDGKFPACPECGNVEDVDYIERIWCNRRVKDVEVESGKLVIDGAYVTTENAEEGAVDPQFECRECGHSWPLPEGLDIEWV